MEIIRKLPDKIQEKSFYLAEYPELQALASQFKEWQKTSVSEMGVYKKEHDVIMEKAKERAEELEGERSAWWGRIFEKAKTLGLIPPFVCSPDEISMEFVAGHTYMKISEPKKNNMNLLAAIETLEKKFGAEAPEALKRLAANIDGIEEGDGSKKKKNRLGVVHDDNDDDSGPIVH